MAESKIEAIINEEQRAEMWKWLISVVSRIPDEVIRLNVSEWAEEHRVLPPDLSSRPGPFRFDITPYLQEITDCFSVGSPVQRVAVMKGAQLGFTVGVLENVLGYIIDVAPGPVLFVSGDREMAEAAVEVRIDRMIESAGLKNKIFSQVAKKHGKKTGDTKSKKEFAGGFLLAVGPNTGSKLRSFSVRYVLFDEVDAYPHETRGEGDPISLAERRTDAFESVRKILYISTPLVEQTSRIKQLYERGDQRKYFIPCRHCGHMQELKWELLKYETDELGRLVWGSVHYECEKCGGHWKNEDKAWFLPRGEWRSTAEPLEPHMRSYHLSALYSPVGMRSWESICEEWIRAKDDPAALRVFVNTVLGEPWVERGEAPRYERVMALRAGGYTSGTLPDDAAPLVVTLGADVQQDRIECEVVAWDKDKESWSIEYLVLPGDTSDIDGPPWRLLYDELVQEHAGLYIDMALIDAGYNSPVVYQFCERFVAGVYPIMGDARLGKGRRVLAWRDVSGYNTKRVDLNVDLLKLELYNYLGKEPGREGKAPPGYCHFPSDYPEKYFRQLVAEERVVETTRTGQRRYVWRLPSGRRNEALDCRVYALGGLYVLLDLLQVETGEELSWADFWRLAEDRNHKIQ